jgi:hypothetical protein
MSNGTTAINQNPSLSRHDTRQSWRVMKNVLILFLSAIAAVLGFFEAFNDASMGDSDAQISTFEAKLNDFIRSATQEGVLKIYGVDFDKSYKRIPTQAGLNEEIARLEDAVNRLVYANQDHAWATVNQAVAEYNFAHSSDKADLKKQSDVSHIALVHEWVRKNALNAVLRGVATGVISGIVTGAISWILLVGLALVWWFLIDRVRDLSRAIKGQ